jgi:cholinesterase
VAYSFQNISGNLGPLPAYFSHGVLAENIGRAYISFVYDYDPNTSRGNGSTLPLWPRYSLEQPQNIVLNASGSYIEDDTYRKEGIAYLNEVNSDLQIMA